VRAFVKNFSSKRPARNTLLFPHTFSAQRKARKTRKATDLKNSIDGDRRAQKETKLTREQKATLRNYAKGKQKSAKLRF
jgi:hypothetical protein